MGVIKLINSPPNGGINPELFKYLSSDDNFPQLLGFAEDGPSPGNISHDDWVQQTADKLFSYGNFNPNILMYELPFTKLMSKVASGPAGGSPTLDANEKIQEI